MTLFFNSSEQSTFNCDGTGKLKDSRLNLSSISQLDHITSNILFKTCRFHHQVIGMKWWNFDSWRWKLVWVRNTFSLCSRYCKMFLEKMRKIKSVWNWNYWKHDLHESFELCAVLTSMIFQVLRTLFFIFARICPSDHFNSSLHMTADFLKIPKHATLALFKNV